MGKVGKRLNRILIMVPLILRKEGASVEELCRVLGTNREELMDDLNVLWFCGLPDYTPADLIDFRLEGDRVYLTMAYYFSRPLSITRQEALALFVAGRALIGAGVFRNKSPLGTALDKLEHLLSEEDRVRIEEISERVKVEMEPFSGKCWGTIEDAIGKGRNLKLEYYSFSRDSIREREVEPESLVWSKGHWYLLAWCHLAEDRRLFRLDRIKSVSLSSNRSARVDREEFYVPELVGEFKPGRKAHGVRLRFAGREGRRLVEEWPTATFKEGKDGTLTVEMRTRNLAWLANYLLKFGDRFEIESPRELERMVEEKASRLAEVYR